MDHSPGCWRRTERPPSISEQTYPIALRIARSRGTGPAIRSRSAGSPTEAFVQRHDPSDGADRFGPAVGQERQHGRVADIGMGESAFALWRAGDDDRRFRVSVAAMKHDVAFDRSGACRLLDTFEIGRGWRGERVCQDV